MYLIEERTPVPAHSLFCNTSNKQIVDLILLTIAISLHRRNNKYSLVTTHVLGPNDSVLVISNVSKSSKTNQ